MQIAIDGPAGSGKSTICKRLAEKYNFIYVDTGAMYRAAAWFYLKFGGENFEKNIEDLQFEFYDNGRGLRVVYDRVVYDITEDIRKSEITSIVSQVAAIPKVRDVLMYKQRLYAGNNDVIMEGRDITTVVLPNAEVKIFLTASSEVRAARRFKEIKESDDGVIISYEQVLNKINKRDQADMKRSIAPLKKASDAVYIDTTKLTLEQVIFEISSIINERMSK